MYRHRYPQKTAFVETYCKDILERVSKGCHLPDHPISMFIGMVKDTSVFTVIGLNEVVREAHGVWCATNP